MERRLSAILAADVVGYSALMERDEAGTFDRLRKRRIEFFEPEIARYHGRIFKLLGDGLLAEFGSVVEAVECAVALQQGMGERNAAAPEQERFNVRIGINLGEVIVDGEDLYGEDVNLAARLEQLASPGGICVSGKVAKAVERKLAFGFDAAGQHKVKNIEEPVDVYHVRIGGDARRRLDSAKRRLSPQMTWSLAGLLAALVLATGTLFAVWHRAPVSTAVSTSIPSIAILPFQDLSPDRSLEYLGDGMASDIIAGLSRFADIAVVSRTSSFAFKDKVDDIRKVGRELGVDYVLEGSVRKQNDQLRVVAELIDAKTGKNVWASSLDKTGAEPLAIQDYMTGQIIGAMTGEWGAIRKADYSDAWGKDSTSLAEYDYYLRAESQLNLYTQEGMERSAELSREGLKAFPDSPLLSVELAWSRFLNVSLFFSSEPAADLDEANRLVDEVLASKSLSPQVARLAHWLRAWLLTLRHEHDQAVVEINKAIAGAPYNAFTLTDAGVIILEAGDAKKALELIDAASPRDPSLAWFTNYARGFTLLVMGRNEEAVAALKQTDFADAPLLQAAAHVRLGQDAEAHAAVERMLKASPTVTVSSWRQAGSFRDPSILDAIAADIARAGLASS